ncbi:MAG: hypothetical protein K0S48_1937 [Ramlibacter sp.]|nr:hypothetical protein [Ramlibacter sp.]
MAERADSSVRPSRYSSLCICLTAAMRSALKSRRFRPTALKPRTASGLPSTSMKGGTSCEMALWKPSIACAPTLTNWWMPVRPPTVTQSPTSTWPPSVALLAMVTLLPTMQSCATCT